MLSYSRSEAGQYQVNLNRMMVGYIKKQSSSKWVLYKGSNPAMLGNSVSVAKTLKELKVTAESIFSELSDEEVIEENLDAMLNQIRNESKIEVNEYQIEKDDWEEVKLPSFFGRKFLTESDICKL